MHVEKMNDVQFGFN